MDYKKFLKYIELAARAHQDNFLPPRGHPDRTHKNGEVNDYYTHPLWCAMMMLVENKLPEKTRQTGALALLFHDVLEDTSEKLPDDFPADAAELVHEMTGPRFAEEVKIFHTKPPMVQLLKLYDKTATLYDGCVQEERYEIWSNFVLQLADNVEKNFGELNIVILGRALAHKYLSLAKK